MVKKLLIFFLLLIIFKHETAIRDFETRDVEIKSNKGYQLENCHSLHNHTPSGNGCDSFLILSI